MGYLDNSSITVDAVVTKRMRRNWALGQTMDVRYFCVSDSGVDYTLYNESHPSGSNSYGEAITNMPNLEASSHASHVFLNKLITLDRNTTFLPTIINVEDTYNFGNRIYKKNIIPDLHPAGTLSNARYVLLISDDSLVRVGGAQRVTSYDNWILPHLQIEDVERVSAHVGSSFTIMPQEVTQTHSVNAVIMEMTVGIWKTFTISMDANEVAPFKDITGVGSVTMGQNPKTGKN